MCFCGLYCFFFKQKTAYEMRISDWSSDVCSSDLGITIGTASSSVTNSGAISGAGAGITTSYLYDAEIDQLVGLAVGTTVENSGTIAGESNDGVRLIGVGSVTNGGTISGAGRADADGISMYAYEGQASEDYVALVTKAAGGANAGERSTEAHTPEIQS